MLKKNEGITLIALIITIVVLLIIAVVAVGIVKESNIIGHAEKAAKDYNSAKDDEQGKISGHEDFMEKYANGGSGTGNGESSNPEQDENEDQSPDDEEDDNKDENSTDKDVPIPEGFYYVTGTKDIGFVISDNPADENNASGKNGNQFVWVPVTEDISVTEYVSSTIYKEPSTVGEIKTDSYGNTTYLYDALESNLRLANCEDIDLDGTLELSDFETELKNMYAEMATSINKYDGFYVGRYETSINGTNPQSKYGETSATGERNSANTWYGLYALNKKYNTNSVRSSMIWGIQYDKMMSWMGEAANTTIGDKKNTERTCGTASEDVIKNVYDLYGNSYEWTLEAYNPDLRTCRGGLYENDYSPSNRISTYPTSTYSYASSRLALYIV